MTWNLRLNYNYPRIIKHAISNYGVAEIVGKKHNAIILGWAKSLGLESVYKNDEIPWCGLVVGYWVKLSKFEVVKNPLWALNWLQFGVAVDVPMVGDVLVFSRKGGNHVGLYWGETDKNYLVLGGNQGNKVSIIYMSKTRLKGARRCNWKIKEPEGVVQRFFKAGLEITSENLS